jgi:hypothetical protein
MKKANFNNSVLFIVSPVLAVPAVFYGIYKKNIFNIGLIVFFIGILSFLYVPSVTNDRASYYRFYEIVQVYNIKQFVLYLGIIKRPDFILHALIYITAKIGINIQFLFLGITTFTVGSFFYLFNKLIEKDKLSNKLYFIGFLLLLFSFSYPHLISGTKHYFAMALFLLSTYYLVIENNTKKSIILIFLSVSTHFSMSLFIPALLVLKKYPYKNNLFRAIFILSFIFLLVPKAFISDLVASFPIAFPTGYDAKIDTYIRGEDFIERGLREGSSNYYLVHFFSIAWCYFAYIYLLVTIKRKSIIRNWIYMFFGLINVFYVIPTIYWRYTFVLKMVFALLIITELNHKRVKPALLTLGIFCVSILSQIIITRYNLIDSYFNKHMFLTIFTFFRNIQPIDFLVL